MVKISKYYENFHYQIKNFFFSPAHAESITSLSHWSLLHWYPTQAQQSSLKHAGICIPGCTQMHHLALPSSYEPSVCVLQQTSLHFSCNCWSYWMTLWNSAALYACIHAKASKHSLLLPIIQCSQPQKEKISLAIFLDRSNSKSSTSPEDWNRDPEQVSYGLSYTDRTFSFTVTCHGKSQLSWQILDSFPSYQPFKRGFPKQRNKQLHPPERKGSYKLFLYENLDSLL